MVKIWFRQAYSAKQLDKLEAEFKVNSISLINYKSQIYIKIYSNINEKISQYNNIQKQYKYETKIFV